MISMLENGCYFSTERLVTPGRDKITRTDFPDETCIITDRVKQGLGMEFPLLDATLMQISCIQQEEQIQGQSGFSMRRGILDLMALNEAGILDVIEMPNTLEDELTEAWQLRGFGFTIIAAAFRQAMDEVSLGPVDWEEVDQAGKRTFLYTENFTSSVGLSRFTSPDNSRYGSAGYQFATLVDTGPVVLPSAPSDISTLVDL